MQQLLLKLVKSKCRYSTLIDQAGLTSHSTPPPTVQPVRVNCNTDLGYPLVPVPEVYGQAAENRVDQAACTGSVGRSCWTNDQIRERGDVSESECRSAQPGADQ